MKLLRFFMKLRLREIRRRLWNKRVLLWWRKLWIRKDEFHSSLDVDAKAMVEMDQKEMEKYIEDLAYRRNLAHRRDLSE